MKLIAAILIVAATFALPQANTILQFVIDIVLLLAGLAIILITLQDA